METALAVLLTALAFIWTGDDEDEEKQDSSINIECNINADAETEVEKTNETLRSEHDLAVKAYLAKVHGIKVEFEKERQAKIKVAAALRINVNPRFQKVVDIFLKKLPDNQD